MGIRWAGIVLILACAGGGCASLSATGDLRNFPVQIFAGTQSMARQGPDRQNEPEFRTTYLEVYWFAVLANSFSDTLLLPVTIPLTAWDVVTPESWHGNFAFERHSTFADEGTLTTRS
jgi:hypothetical protein